MIKIIILKNKKFIICVLINCLAIGCGNNTGKKISDNETKSETEVFDNQSELANNYVIKGKLAQGYVRGAQVWFDKVSSNGLGNFLRDPGENDGVSDENGSYSLSNPVGNILLATTGGTFLNSQGVDVPAMPMLAPAPDPTNLITNITPITTLVAAVPELKNKFNNLGDWNADIAHPDGTSAPLLRLAKTVESFSSILSSGEQPIILNKTAQIQSLVMLAQELNKINPEDIINETSLKDLTTAVLVDVLDDDSLINVIGEKEKSAVLNSMAKMIEKISETIPDSGTVIEIEVIDNLDLLQEELNNEVSQLIKDQVIVNFGGLGFEFDPVITKILLRNEDDKLYMSAEVSDERPEALSYLWTTQSDYVIDDHKASEASIANFENTSISVSLQITDDTGYIAAKSCTFVNILTECLFLITE
ncbi:MAG: hypothetical protein P8O70_00350 [SAR324 cluster bacterium]|nr:hypothetical protein [SAR324 cluster bacterium]